MQTDDLITPDRCEPKPKIGRPLLGPEKIVEWKRLGLTQKQLDKVRANGGDKWIRSLIDSA